MKRSRSPRSHPTVVRLSSFRSPDPKRAAVPVVTRIPTITGRSRRLRATAAFIPNGFAVRAPALQPDGFLFLVLPLPPSINHHYATVQGRRVLSSEGRRFKTLVGQEVLCALAKRKAGPPSNAIPAGVPLGLDLHFYFISEIRRDIDGGLKITQDAICEALGINDNRIVEVILHKEKDVTSPRMELSLRVCSPPIP
ncbi:MAG TPA: RusA family crossover junction endodeoxyribonuclease [Nitrospirales bacterium]|nr:RusA family crossover junction endodeoxyribonuclease [Nitrospirales bacterium]